MYCSQEECCVTAAARVSLGVLSNWRHQLHCTPCAFLFAYASCFCKMIYFVFGLKQPCQNATLLVKSCFLLYSFSKGVMKHLDLMKTECFAILQGSLGRGWTISQLLSQHLDSEGGKGEKDLPKLPEHYFLLSQFWRSELEIVSEWKAANKGKWCFNLDSKANSQLPVD